METTKKKISDLKPYEGNARINDKTVEKLADAYERYGYVVPIVVDQNNVVVAGHARLKAAQKLGWDEIDCLTSDLSDEKNKEFRVIDNKIQEISEWNDELLVVELRALDYLVSEFDMKIESALTTSFGLDVSEVTDDDIKKSEDGFDNVFGDRVDKAQDRIVSICCEHCGTEFGVEAEKVGL